MIIIICYVFESVSFFEVNQLQLIYVCMIYFICVNSLWNWIQRYGCRKSVLTHC